MIKLRIADIHEFETIRQFYWNIIDRSAGKTDTVLWKKGIYPSDAFLMDSIRNGEMYVADADGTYAAAVVLNSCHNPGYEGLSWKIDCPDDEVMMPHVLAVHPDAQGRGIGKKAVLSMIEIAREKNKKTIRLDVLSGNTAAMKLYEGMGFRFVKETQLYYEDTGWAVFRMYEMIL